MVGLHLEAEAAVVAGLRLARVQVDEDLGVAEGAATSVTAGLRALELGTGRQGKAVAARGKEERGYNGKKKRQLTTLAWTFLGGTAAIRSIAHWVFTCFSVPVTAKRTCRRSWGHMCRQLGLAELSVKGVREEQFSAAK